MYTEDELIKKLNSFPENIEFDDTISAIQNNYTYTPSKFTNGSGADSVINNAGENEGSCKIFAFAKLHNLTEQQTLHCFGHYYRDDVLTHPDNKDHVNIRQFMKHGWKHVTFEKEALTKNN